MLTFWNIALFTGVVIVNLALGFIVLRRNKHNIINQAFFVMIFSAIAWLIFNLLADGDTRNALLWNKLTFGMGAFMILSILYFPMIFPAPLKSLWPYIIAFIPALLIFVLSIGSSLIVERVDALEWGSNAIPGSLYFLYPLFIGLFLTSAIVALYLRFRRAHGRDKASIRYVYLGFVATLITGFITNQASFWIFDDFRLARYAPIALLFFFGFTTYAIIAHRLFDIRVIIKKTVIYSGLLAFVIGTYSLIIFTLASLFGTQSGLSRQTFLPNLIAALVVAVGFDPLRRWLIKTTDQYLFVGEYRPEEVLRELSRTLSGVIDLDEALQGMMQILVKNMRLKRAATFVLRRFKEGVEVKRVKSIGFDGFGKLKLEKNDPLISHFDSRLEGHRGDNERRHLAVVTEELDRRIEEGGRIPSIVPAVRNRLSELGAAVALPLVVNKQLIGILILSEKLSGDIYTSTDLDFLEIVAHETAGSIEKARFWEEDQLKSEFVSIASHELLTPTSTIQGYLSMILDEGMGKVDPKAREYLEAVRRTSRRLTELVQDLLNVSRIEAGRIKIDPKPMDLLAEIRQVVADLTPEANTKGLSVHFEDPDQRPTTDHRLQTTAEAGRRPSTVDRRQTAYPIFADPERVRQVLTNLIGNAVKYTPQGGVTVSVNRESRFVKVSVADTGIGMTPEERRHLFEKFYRIQNEGTQGITGTGLGLYITKHIIELMGGKIEAESTAGRGSTFTVMLPAATATPAQKSKESGK